MFALLAFLAATAAQAAPAEADIDCIAGRVPASARAEIVEEAGSGTGGPVREAIEQAARACAAERGWAEDHMRASAMAAGAVLLAREVAPELERAGVPTDAIDRWFAAEPAQVRTNFELAPNTIERLFASLQSQGVSEAALEASGHRIGLYVGSLIALQELSARSGD